MRIDLIPMKEFIKLNSLQEITNPVMYDKGYTPTVDGLLSTEIFGVSTNDRRDTYAYINLHGHFLHPFMYKLLKRMNRNFQSIIQGTKNFKIENGEFIEDDEGSTGLEFLYKNWKNIDFKRNDSRMRNERIDLLEASSIEEIFCEYWIVIPAFYRDMNLQKKSPGHEKINEYYTKLIRLASVIKSASNFDFILDTTRGKIQQTLEEIYDNLKGKVEKKQGFIKKSLLGKSIDYGARLVISADKFVTNKYDEKEVDFYHTGVPLATCCAIFTPFIVAWVKNFFMLEFERRQNKIPLVNEDGEIESYIKVVSPELFYTEDYIKKQLDRFVSSFEDRFEKVELPLTDADKKLYPDLGLTIAGNYWDDDTKKDSSSTQFGRDLTWCDIFYLAAVDVVSNKHIYVTRYPILDYFGTFPSKVAILSTQKTVPVVINETVYKNYPDIDLSMPKEKVSSYFVDTIVMSNVYLKGLGGDSNESHYTVMCN